MNAYEVPNLRFSLPAGEAITRRRFVKADANGAAILADSGTVIGVSMNQAASGEALDIADGIVIVEASAAIAAGADISATADGKAVTAAAGVVVGVALTDAAGAGNFIAVKIV